MTSELESLVESENVNVEIPTKAKPICYIVGGIASYAAGACILPSMLDTPAYMTLFTYYLGMLAGANLVNWMKPEPIKTTLANAISFSIGAVLSQEILSNF